MFAVIFIPDFSLQAVLRHEPELISRPAALMDPELTKLGIIQLTATARIAGVCEGMTATQAIGRCTDLVIKSRAPTQELAATDVLMQTAYAFSPFIESTGPGVCTVELRGLRAQENEASAQEWAEEIRAVLIRFHLDGRIGFAVTPELALLAARLEKLQTPNSKLQGNSKPQAPNEPQNPMTGTAAFPCGAIEFWASQCPSPQPSPQGEGESEPARPHTERPRPCPPLEMSPPLPEGEGRSEGKGIIQRTPQSAKKKSDETKNLDIAVAGTGALQNAPIQIVTDIAEFASRLPIQMLGLSAEMLDILHRWGITTAGALLTLGKDEVVARLGSEAIKVFERFSPDSIRPLEIASSPETFAEQMEFENPIETLEPLLFVLRRFTEQLSRRIELLYLVVAELHLKLGLVSGATYESVFKVPSPTGNAEILFRMLHTYLANVRTDAPISLLWLSAKPGRLEAHQFGLFETTLRNPNQFAETLARLEALCGPNRVGTPCLEPTLRPDAVRMKPPEFCESGEKKRSRASGALRARSVRARTGKLPARCNELSSESNETRKVGRAAPSAVRAVRKSCESQAIRTVIGGLGIARPTFQHGLQLRRFRPALAARIEFREEGPALIRSAVCNGPIMERRGPFLISGNWWDDSRWWRQEWDIQMTDGRMYRIFRTRERFDTKLALTPALSPEEREDHLDVHEAKSASSPRRLSVSEPVMADECFVEGVYD